MYGVDQIIILASGVSAVWLSQDSRLTWRRWSSVLGLISQPFWFYATWKAGQWGIFLATFLYTYSWARGFWTNWILPRRNNSDARVLKNDAEEAAAVVPN